MSVALYARVSTDDKNQNPETQLYALRNYCSSAGLEIYREYVDYARAKDWKRRKSWTELQKDARQRKFKTVLVFRLDRAFRSVKECVNLVEDWYERGITFKSLSEDVIDTTTSSGRFILQIMAAIAEIESSI
ncbi:MAG: recombinase family protein, partial [Dehalococcoidales bacterium]